MKRTKVQLKPNFNQFITWTQGPFPLAETFSQDLKCSQVKNFAKVQIEWVPSKDSWESSKF